VCHQCFLPCRWFRGGCCWCKHLERGFSKSKLSNIHMLMLCLTPSLYKWRLSKGVMESSITRKIAQWISSNLRGQLIAVFHYYFVCMCSVFKLTLQFYAIQFVKKRTLCNSMSLYQCKDWSELGMGIDWAEVYLQGPSLAFKLLDRFGCNSQSAFFVCKLWSGRNSWSTFSIKPTQFEGLNEQPSQVWPCQFFILKYVITFQRWKSIL